MRKTKNAKIRIRGPRMSNPHLQKFKNPRIRMINKNPVTRKRIPKQKNY